ncbi:DnaB-like helicase C-terminal domain-containing protein [Acrocarpospora sp. B8E8]|uniref:DnaB-like helicase C-terminal domain-containing protein n=1 Tax=Acrocarpospora sp. B8E8 TaxID=3153572 RepID=UPI00325D882C
MFLLARAQARAGNTGDPLPTVWRTLEAASVRFRRGQMALVAAGPGVGKSVFALTAALRSGASGLYFSADSDESTMYSRACSMLSGHEVADVQSRMEAGEAAVYADYLERCKRLRFSFDPAPTLEAIERSVKAYAYVYGRWPEFICLDNLADCTTDEDGFHGLEVTLDFLHGVKRATGAFVLVLHHLTGEYENGDAAPPLGALRGKVSKKPEIVLGLYRPSDGRLGVAITKNRTGRANAAGRLTVELDMDLSRMSITDPQPMDLGKGNLWTTT